MSADVQNRSVIREAFAALLTAALVGSGKPAQKVFPYRVSDFKGKYSVVVVASAPANRSKQAQVTRVSSLVKLDIHNFVLYAAVPVQATNNPAAGSAVVVYLPNTGDFSVGDQVTIEDAAHVEKATISIIVPNTSITVSTLANSYTAPTVSWWTERDAEDRLDLLEKSIADVMMDNDTNELWAQVSFEGDHTPDDITIGGKDYLHEIMHLVFQLHSD